MPVSAISAAEARQHSCADCTDYSHLYIVVTSNVVGGPSLRCDPECDRDDHRSIVIMTLEYLV